MRAALHDVASMTIDEAATTADKAALVRKLVGKWKHAAAITKTALLLECLALRRIGTLVEDPREHLPKNPASAAKLFATLSEDDLRAEVANYHGAGALGLRTWIMARQRNCDASTPLGAGSSWRQLRRAAADIIASAVYEGEPVTVEALAARLASNSIEIRDRATKEGAQAAIRSAAVELAKGWAGDGADTAGIPQTVTVNDSSLGWIRMPWHVATVAQLRFMADLRAEQAAALACTAKKLAAIADELEIAAGPQAVLPEALLAREAAGAAREAAYKAGIELGGQRAAETVARSLREVFPDDQTISRQTAIAAIIDDPDVPDRPDIDMVIAAFERIASRPAAERITANLRAAMVGS
jgi:hypothetical protein